MPVVVYNVGQEEAENLNLTRIILNNQEAGKFLGKELLNRGYTKPILVRFDNVDETTTDIRYAGICEALGSEPDFFTVFNYNDTHAAAEKLKTELTDTAKYDSIISMGGAVSFSFKHLDN